VSDLSNLRRVAEAVEHEQPDRMLSDQLNSRLLVSRALLAALEYRRATAKLSDSLNEGADPSTGAYPDAAGEALDKQAAADSRLAALNREAGELLEGEDDG
jgi:hypothetical protein